ncbi:MAG: DNA-binding protein [Erysipelotrichia bacterium]|nr:DNA-binding protein [Erysipelotrichia bacterium]
MDFNEAKQTINQMIDENYKDFIKALVSVEKGIDDNQALDIVFEDFMASDNGSLLHEDFDYSIENLREQGQIKQSDAIEVDQDDLVNIVGNVIGEVEVVDRENKDGTAFKVVNFSVVSKDDDGSKIYTNCSAYGEKSEIPKDFKKGDFIKLFGQLRTSVDENGKEHSNVRILSSKLLKSREQMNEKDEKQEKKPSILGAIKDYQKNDKSNDLSKKENKGQER